MGYERKREVKNYFKALGLRNEKKNSLATEKEKMKDGATIKC